jgi:anti-sigma factor RsiW
MNCDKCQELLSDFLDGALNEEDHESYGAHLKECLPCYTAHDELNSIVSFCREHRGDYSSPPNERALWLRIRNTIENETSLPATQAARPAAAQATSGNWVSRWMNRSWELSTSQMAGAIAVIVIIVALGTAFSLQSVQNVSSGSSRDVAGMGNGGSAQGAPMSKSLVTASTDVDGRLRSHQMEISYWSERVELRKVRWTPQTRDAFDRNLSVYDQVIEESRRELQRNPHDEVSEEMLNAALNDKVELLKEFSDQ